MLARGGLVDGVAVAGAVRGLGRQAGGATAKTARNSGIDHATSFHDGNPSSLVAEGAVQWHRSFVLHLGHIAKALLVWFIVLMLLPARMAEAAPAPQSASPAGSTTAAVTHHVAVIGGSSIRYTATAGTIEVTGLGDQSRAALFYVAYTADTPCEEGPRPLTFAYNGGPGGSAALVHMAAFGPRTIRMADAAGQLAGEDAEVSALTQSNAALLEATLKDVLARTPSGARCSPTSG